MRFSYISAAPGIPVRGPSGASAHLRGLFAALQRRGNARLYAAKNTDHRGVFGPELPATAVGVPGWPSWLSGTRELREVRSARRIVRRIQEDAHRGFTPDLILERHSLFSDAGWRASERLGVPWILEVNAPLVQERTRFEDLHWRTGAVRWERDVLRAAPRIAAVSRWLVKWLRQEVGCRDVQWVPNGVTPHRGDRARGRAALKLGPSQPAVGFVGSGKPWHGQDRLATVARTLGAVAVWIGPSPPQRPGLPPEQVRTTGHLSGQALADAVAALDVGLVPYRSSAPPWFCPLKVFDYRAQGVPVVGSDIGDVAALVRGGGVAVPADSDDALIEATRAWLGQRPPPRLRTWNSVLTDILEGTRRAA